MPRTRRIVLPGHPHHILQRGHNRQSVFKGEGDYRQYLDDLLELKEKFGIRVHAWCLIYNEVHLLLTPESSAAQLSSFMKTLATRTTRHRNRKEQRTGTLWESRYRSSPVQDQWLLACDRYIEVLPVKYGAASSVARYAWSSYNMRLGLIDEDWLDEDPAYLALGDTKEGRRSIYRAYVEKPIDEIEWQRIHQAVVRCQLTGDSRFADYVEQLTDTRIHNRGRGRPPKEPS